MLAGSYNPSLVALSVLVAMLASFTALDMASRVSAWRHRGAAGGWLLAGAVAMGTGIWSMHFVGMLALRLPIPLGYALWPTLESLLVAIATSLFALWLVSRPAPTQARLALGALLMGLGIAWMHYAGMAALRMRPAIDYAPSWVALSIVIAVGASWAALFIALRMRSRARPLAQRLAAAAVMGLGIVGMHYTGMAAARFAAGSVCTAATGGGIGAEWLAAGVLLLAVAMMAVVLVISLFEQRLQARLLRRRNTTLSASLDGARKELFHASRHDPLTGLPNRQLSHERIEQLLQQCRATGLGCAVMTLDLDEFRHINSAFGPQAGDAVMVDVAEQLRRQLPDGGLVGRLGGDQYVIALPLADDAAAAPLAERILMAVNTVRVDERDMRVTASLGLALYPAQGATAPQLLAHAETATRHAKQAGRNRHARFAAWMSADAEQDRRLLEDLRQALVAAQLSLHYQPRVHGDSGLVTGAEALLRWRHPVHGPVPSARIIRLAEQHGLIDVIGRWVLDEACRQMRCWHDAGHPGWQVSVNLSGLQLGSPCLVEEVRRVLQRHELAPSRLVLEVSENAVTRDADAAIAVLRAVAALGVGISIDDFGTGFSSLLQLRRLPATEIKIDRAFVMALEDSDEDVVVVSAIVALGHALDMEVVAKGIETPGQRTYAERLGCDHLQGYQLGRPVGPESFMRLYASGGL